MRDIILGIVFTVGGLLIVLTTRDYPAASSVAVDPAFFPRVIGVSLAGIGALIALSGARGARKRRRVMPTQTRTVMAPAAAGAGTVSKPAATPADSGPGQPDDGMAPVAPGDAESLRDVARSLLRLTPFVTVSVVYVWVAFSSGLGYTTSTFLFLTFVMIWLSQKRSVKTYLALAGLSAVLSAALYAVFVIGLQVPIPVGLLP